MKKVLLSLAAVSAIAVAAPAAAQPYGHYDYRYQAHSPFSPGTSINSRQITLRSMIAEAHRHRRITGHEADRLMGELRRIEAVERTYRRTGRRIAPRERNELIARLDRVYVQLQVDSRDGYRRHDYGYGYGRW